MEHTPNDPAKKWELADFDLLQPSSGARLRLSPRCDQNSCCDSNGNQTTRVISGQTVQLDYDAENRLVTVTGTNLSAQFTYNGDGQRVKSVINGETIFFVGGYYEFNDTTDEVTKYYFAGASRIAVRKYVVPQTTTLTYLLGDHLGSTSLAVDASTGEVIETRYKPWGEVRYTTEDLIEPIEEITLPTRYTFTGQYSYMDDEATDLGAAGLGLMFYNARWYDPMTGRFAQADTVVPGGVQGLDRYAYVNNSPVRYTDPTGHRCEPGDYEPHGYCWSPPTETIVFGGSGETMGQAGPSPHAQMDIWTTDINGNPVPPTNLIPYPGDPGRKVEQARAARGLAPDSNVILICYSAGAEACLMYAKWRIENGQLVQAVVLLGPTFESPQEIDGPSIGFGSVDDDSKFDDWADYIDYITTDGEADVLVIDDIDQAQTGSEASGFNSRGAGKFHYEYWGVAHYTTKDWTSTNNNPEMRTYVYNWILSPNQIPHTPSMWEFY